MNTSAIENIVRLFGMSGLMIEGDIRGIEKERGVHLGHLEQSADDRDDVYYPQFEQRVRLEAAQMSRHYEIFYCLERSIRGFIVERLKEEKGVGWWRECVPQNVRDNVGKNMQRDLDSGFTVRSTESIDFTTFGELGDIIKENWATFQDTFNSRRALERVLANLNVLRGPIAHCCVLAPDEIVRLRLTVRDWFRLME